MTTAEFITRLRRKYNDIPTKHEDIRTGDGISTFYKLKYSPILESSCSLYINNALKAEGAGNDYLLDYDTGDITLASVTTFDIKARYKEVKFRDQGWLEAIQSAFESLGDQFFTTVLRDDPIAIPAQTQKVDMPAGCIRVIEVLEAATEADQWTKPRINMRYDRRSNILVLGNAPTSTRYYTVSYQKKLTAPTAVGDDLEIDDNWLPLIELKAGSEYLRSMANRIAQQGSATIEEGHLSVGTLRQLANDNEVLFENLKRKLKPVMPNSDIPYWIPTGGSA